MANPDKDGGSTWPSSSDREPEGEVRGKNASRGMSMEDDARGLLSMPAESASADKGPPSWRVVFGGTLVAWSALALVFFSATFSAARLADTPLGAGRVFGQSVLHAYTWVPVSVLALLYTRRFPLVRGKLLQHAAVHCVAAVPLIVGRMALFHFLGQAAGLLRRDVSFPLAFAAFFGESVTTYLLVIGSAHALVYARSVRKRDLAREQLRTELIRAQLHALKLQLHPHFLFNTLHAITTLVHVDPGRAERVIANLSELLRQALAHRESQEVSLRDELAALSPYLEIERMRLGDRFSVEMDLEDGVLAARVPHLLLQPLVENAVRHGISVRRDGGRVRIQVRRNEGKLRLTVSDDGPGISGGASGSAVGLANTRARLVRLYGARHLFQLHSVRDQGTSVHIELPLRLFMRDSNPAIR